MTNQDFIQDLIFKVIEFHKADIINFDLVYISKEENIIIIAFSIIDDLGRKHNQKFELDYVVDDEDVNKAIAKINFCMSAWDKLK